eukprot:2643643-Pyramimonas_sp.AAC.1
MNGGTDPPQESHLRRRREEPRDATPKHGHRHHPHLAAGLKQRRPRCPRTEVPAPPTSGDPFE